VVHNPAIPNLSFNVGQLHRFRFILYCVSHYYSPYFSIVFHFRFIIYFLCCCKILKFGALNSRCYVRKSIYSVYIERDVSFRTRKNNWCLLVYPISIRVLPPAGRFGAFFGISIWRIPLFILAEIFEGSISSGIGMLR
jgi:hypothetical protein